MDIRKAAPSFGRSVSCTLSAGAWNQLLIPKGFGHGFLTLEPDTEVFYKVSAPYAPDHERAIRYDDPALAITWPLQGATPIMSAKDRAAPSLAGAVP